MRQAGILAAAGIVSLEKMVDRLVEDHSNADLLGQGLMDIDGIEPGMDIPSNSTLTNIVYFKLSDEVSITSEMLVERCEREHQVKIDPGSYRQFRLVTHYWVTHEDVGRTLEAFRRILGSLK